MLGLAPVSPIDREPSPSDRQGLSLGLHKAVQRTKTTHRQLNVHGSDNQISMAHVTLIDLATVVIRLCVKTVEIQRSIELCTTHTLST